MTDFKNEYDFYKVKPWVNIEKIEWWRLVKQKNAVPFIEKYFDILNEHIFTTYHYELLSKNPFAVELLRKHPDKIVWMEFVCNPNGMHVIEEHLDVCFQSLNTHGVIQLLYHKIDWFKLCNNKNAHLILEERPDKIKCYSFIDYENFSTDLPIFEYDYHAIEKKCNIYKEELMQIALHPSRIESYLQQGICVEDLDKYI